MIGPHCIKSKFGYVNIWQVTGVLLPETHWASAIDWQQSLEHASIIPAHLPLMKKQHCIESCKKNARKRPENSFTLNLSGKPPGGLGKMLLLLLFPSCTLKISPGYFSVVVRRDILTQELALMTSVSSYKHAWLKKYTRSHGLLILPCDGYYVKKNIYWRYAVEAKSQHYSVCRYI